MLAAKSKAASSFANGINNAASTSSYVPPSISPIQTSSIPHKAKVARWRTLSDKNANADASNRLLCYGSHGEVTNELRVHTYHTAPEKSSSILSRNGSASTAASAASAFVSSSSASSSSPNNTNASAAAPAAITERLSPSAIASVLHDGDVVDIRFVSDSVLATASSNGSVYLYSLNAQSGGGGSNDMDVDEKKSSKNKSSKAAKSASTTASAATGLKLIDECKALHNGGPCTSLDYNPSNKMLVSVGEDGAMHFLSPHTSIKQPTQSIRQANSGSSYGVRWNGPSSVVVCGMSGRLQLFDIRSSASASSSSSSSSTATTKASAVAVLPNSIGLMSLCVHPSRPETIATGSAEGILSIWDIRQTAVPVASLQAHTSIIFDVLFLPSLPTSILTCSEDGGINLCDFNKTKKPPSLITYSQADSPATNIQPLVLYAGHLPVNRLDVDPNSPEPQTIVAATDSHELRFLDHYFMRDN